MIAHYLTIHLASDEYGNEIMTQAAREAFDTHPELDVVEVYEHGGWYMNIDRSGRVVGSANDAAVYTPEIIAWWKAMNSRDWKQLPSIYRNSHTLVGV